MSNDNETPFRPLRRQEEPSLATKLLAAAYVVGITAGIAIIGAAVTVAVTAACLVLVGNFALSFWNVVGIGLLWWVADLGLRQGLRDVIRREQQ